MKNIPARLLSEAQGHVVTIELSSGQSYRGTLVRSEENMNMQLSDVLVTARDGQVSKMDQVYVRGSHVTMVILPEIFKYAPVFRPQTLEKAHAINRARNQTYAGSKRRAGPGGGRGGINKQSRGNSSRS